MKKIIIIGNGICARMLKKYVESTDFAEVVAYSVDEKYCVESEIDGIPVVDINHLRELYSCSEYSVLLGVGYKRGNKIREQLFYRCREMGYFVENYIHPTVIIPPNYKIGQGNILLEGVILQIGSELGNANLIYAGTSIGHDTIVGDFNTMSLNVTFAGCSKIGNNCFFGVSSNIRDGIVVGDKVVVGQGASVFKNTNDNMLVRASRSFVEKYDNDLII